MIYQLRPYQEECIAAIYDYFGRAGGNPICALPTGTGKSLVIAEFIRRLMMQWPGQRVMMLTHVKELIEQNAQKLLDVWASAPLGIYSAGLSARDMAMPIIYGGVQSVAPEIRRSLERGERHFGHRDLLIIDEGHLVSEKDDSHYQFIIRELKAINPLLKVIGFTATPYRTKTGMLTDGGIFTDICYDITGFESFNRLIAEGWLSPLIVRPMQTEIDVSGVRIIGGEFSGKGLEKAADTDEVVNGAVSEMMQVASNRHCWMVFASGIDNTEHVASVIQSYGLDVLPVHSKLPARLNTERLNAFKAGELRGLVSGQKLTTGFDHPPIDYIADLNPTMSPGKHVQKLGRGTRPAPGKLNCLYSDFSGNVRRLGPINDPRIPGRPGKGTGEAPIRICPQCGFYSHASVRRCENCGLEFTFETKIFSTASDLSPLKDDAPIVEYFDVQKVLYNLHEKRNAEGVLIRPPMIKVSYFCGLQMFNEFVMLEHGGMAARKSQDWWRQRHAEEPPATTHEALRRVSQLRVPSKLRVWLNKKYPEILSAEW